MSQKIKVLIVDDSALVRSLLEKGLSKDPGIEVVGKANDVYVARDKIVMLKPDVLTLDVEMPRMDGIEFLKRLMPQHPLPVVMVSSLTQSGASVTLRALEAGAIDFVPKPSVNLSSGLDEMLDDLIEKIKIAAKVDVKHWKEKQIDLKKKIDNKKHKILEGSTDKVVAIGASTGGTVALTQILREFPADMPGTVIVQHMPPVFTRMFAETLTRETKLYVKEAEDGDRIIRGRVLIAPGDRHMEVRRSGGQYLVHIFDGEKVNGHRPSVGVLFNSVADQVGSNAIGLILTGMGQDGALEMKKMREAGAPTIAQDEKTSVVYGMPKVAFECGGASEVRPLDQICGRLVALINEKGKG